MKTLTVCVVFELTLLSVAACTEMPVIKPNALHQQAKLTSASHWQLIAVDLSRDIRGMKAVAVDGQNMPRCVRVGDPEGAPTRFQQFLADTITEELVSPEGMADATRSVPSADSGDKPTRVNFDVYRRDARVDHCDDIVIDSHVIKHAGTPGQPWPGRFTLLAAGAIVIKHVVGAFSDARLIGTVALGETAWWATSGFHASDTVTEIVVTVSRLDESKRYVAQFTNVYYINSSDSGFYEATPPKPTPAPDISPTPAELSRQARREEEKWRRAEEIRHQAELAPARITVAPRVISACDPTPRMFVTGTFLSPWDHDYLLGTMPASDIDIHSRPLPDDPPDVVWTVEVTFKGIKSYNKGGDVVPLAMKGVNGRTAVAYVAIDSTCSKATKSPSQPNSDASTSSGPKKPDVSFAPKAGVAGDPVNLCASPVVLEATESNGAVITAVETCNDEHAAAISQDAGSHKKTITFTNLPAYSNASELPDKHQWKLQVTLASGKPLTKAVQVSCVPAKPATQTTPQVHRLVPK
jgi:hypothetical protein